MDFLDDTEMHFCIFALSLDAFLVAIFGLALIIFRRNMNRRMERLEMLVSTNGDSFKRCSMDLSNLEFCLRYYSEKIKKISTKLEDQELMIGKLHETVKNFIKRNDAIYNVDTSAKKESARDETEAKTTTTTGEPFPQTMHEKHSAAEQLEDDPKKSKSLEPLVENNQTTSKHVMESVTNAVKQSLEELYLEESINRETFLMKIKDLFTLLEQTAKLRVAEAYDKHLERLQRQENIFCDKIIESFKDNVDYLIRTILSSTELQSCIFFHYVSLNSLALKMQDHFDRKLDLLQETVTKIQMEVGESTNNANEDMDEMLDDIDIELVPNM